MQMKLAGVALFAACLGGSAAAEAVNCDEAITTVDMTECAQAAYDAADAALNAAYQAAMAVMKSVDADLPKPSQGAAEALKKSQRAWIEVRDGTCAAEGYLWEGGTGQSLAVLSCLAAQTEARADVLAGFAAVE